MNEISLLRKWHEEQIGTAETPLGSNRIRYNNLYWGADVEGEAYPWCMAYIWAGFLETDLSHLFYGGKKTASCTALMRYAKSNNQWVTKDYVEGDIILLNWDDPKDADHCGFCTGLVDKDGRYQCIEGNVHDRVEKVYREKSEILGAYRPVYSAVTNGFSTPRYGEKSSAVGALQSLLIYRGEKLPKYGVDGEWGKETQEAVSAFRSKHHLKRADTITTEDWKALTK